MSRYALRDTARLALLGPRARPLRAALAALGVAIGIGATVAVLGVSSSSRAELLAELDRLGTNLLTVAPGRAVGGEEAALPATAPAMIGRIGPVERASAISQLSVSVRRNAHIPVADTGSISVAAAQPNLLDTVAGQLAAGRFLDAAVARLPVAVLGSQTAAQLGVSTVDGRGQVFLAERWIVVVGILRPVTLAPELDRCALIGFPEAEAIAAHPVSPTTIYVRVDPEDVTSVQAVLARTTNPAHPALVSVARPSDALVARAAAKSALTSLFFGLGAIALIVGGIGIANVMFVSVLERRREIGLRRALGAGQASIAAQFLAESLAIAGAGGAFGWLGGALVTALWARAHHWPITIPPVTAAGGVGAALVIGGLAGLYPARRAARLAPAEAIRTV